MTMTKLLASGFLALTLALGLGAVATAQETAPETPVEVKDFTLGNPDAPVKITEYASFTCPHCAVWTNEVLPEFKTRFIDTGQVRLDWAERFSQYDAVGDLGDRQRGFAQQVDSTVEAQGGDMRKRRALQMPSEQHVKSPLTGTCHPCNLPGAERAVQVAFDVSEDPCQGELTVIGDVSGRQR